MLDCAVKVIRRQYGAFPLAGLLSGALLLVTSGCAQHQSPAPQVVSSPAAVPFAAGQSERNAALDGVRRSSGAPPSVMDIAMAWRLALLNDPAYQAALSQRAAAETERAQGRAALLPQIQASYYRGRVRGNRYLPDMHGVHQESELNYDSTNGSIQLQQPIFNYAKVATYRRGVAQAEEGAARFTVQGNQTGVRLAEAYFRLLLAQGRLDLQRALVSTLETRVQTLEAHYQQDEGTRTEVAETRARLAVARADTISAEDELNTALRELALMVGRTPDALALLHEDFTLQPLMFTTVVQWLDHAKQHNPEIELARKALVLADTEVDAATALFLPTADLVAGYNHANSGEVDTISQKSNTVVVGIQVNIPIFAGGYSTAERAKASAQRRVAQSQYDATVEQVQADVIREFTRVDGGADRIQALEQAEASSALSLEAASKSFEYGIASNLDVLKAQDTLHETRHDLLSARLEYLIARVRLAAAADIVQDQLFEAVSTQFLDGRPVSD